MGTEVESPQVEGPDEVCLLVVEDSPEDVLLARRLLRGAEPVFRITRAETFAGAIRCIERERVDVVLLDLHLPDADVLEALVRLHSARPSIPIVVWTGLADETLARRCLEHGAQDFVEKDLARDGAALATSLLRALERSRAEARFATVVGRLADGVVVMRPDGQVLFANPAAHALFDRRPGTMVGQPFPRRTEDGVADVEVELPPGPSGEPRAAEMRLSDVVWLGEAARLATIRDISHRREQELLREQLMRAEKLAAVGQLAAGVAHEVNNPATFVLGFLGFAREHLERACDAQAGLSPQQLEDLRELIECCQSGVRRISSVVRELRIFSHLERSEVERLDLSEIARSAIALCQSDVRHYANLESSFDAMRVVEGDRRRLSQAVISLILRAVRGIEWQDRGRHTIWVRTIAAEAHASLVVEDDGTTLSEAALRTLLDPEGPVPEAGLGLTLAAETVRVHGGEIRAERRPGGGTRVTIQLPWRTGLVAADPDERGRRAARERPAQPPRRPRVLVVDDEEFVTVLAKRILEPRYEVTTASNGRAALERLRGDDPFDAIVSDVLMPEIDGVALYEHVREGHPRLASRFLFITGAAYNDRARTLLAREMIPILEKPFSAADLSQRVEALLAVA